MTKTYIAFDAERGIFVIREGELQWVCLKSADGCLASGISTLDAALQCIAADARYSESSRKTTEFIPVWIGLVTALEPQPKRCLLSLTDSGAELIEFDSEEDRLEFLAKADNTFDDFYFLDVHGQLVDYGLAAVGEDAQGDLQELRAHAGVITQTRITAMPVTLNDPMPMVLVRVGEGDEVLLFEYYPDEIAFTSSDFLGLTLEEANALKHSKDVAYLQS